MLPREGNFYIPRSHAASQRGGSVSRNEVLKKKNAVRDRTGYFSSFSSCYYHCLSLHRHPFSYIPPSSRYLIKMSCFSISLSSDVSPDTVTHIDRLHIGQSAGPTGVSPGASTQTLTGISEMLDNKRRTSHPTFRTPPTPIRRVPAPKMNTFNTVDC